MNRDDLVVSPGVYPFSGARRPREHGRRFVDALVQPDHITRAAQEDEASRRPRLGCVRIRHYKSL